MHQIATRILTEPCITSASDSTAPGPGPGPSLFAYCPTMDLVATVSQPLPRGKASVDVWRLNGQNVFGANFDDDGEGDDGDRDGNGERDLLLMHKVRGLCWRRDGEFFS